MSARTFSDWWGVASADGGVWAIRRTRREALLEAGFATPVARREQVQPGIYHYTSSEGSWVVVGRLVKLLMAGYRCADGVQEAAHRDYAGGAKKRRERAS